MKIVKKCIMNFLYAFKYYIPSIGLISIGLLIGIAGFLNLAKDNVNTLINVMEKSLDESSTMNLSNFKDTVIFEFKNLPWNNMWQVLGTLFSKTFLENTLAKGVLAVIGSDAYNEEVSGNVANAAQSISQGFTSFSVWFSIGILASYIYIKISVKKDLKMKVPFKKTILVIILNYILNITLVALATYLLGLAPIGSLLTLIIMIFINQGIALLEAYLSRSQESIKFKKVFTFKNVSLLTLGSVIISIFTLIYCILLIGLSNQTIGLILSLPLYFILISVINFNAFSYIKDYYFDLRR